MEFSVDVIVQSFYREVAPFFVGLLLLTLLWRALRVIDN